MSADNEGLGSWSELTWTGQLTPARASAVHTFDGETTAHPFTATAGDPPSTYWVKAMEGPEGPFAVIAEAIVSGVGRLISAPVCEGDFIDVSAHLGFEFAPGYVLSEPLAYGVRDVAGARDSRMPQGRPIADNRQRLAREYVLYQWCLGGDEQWLIDPDDKRLYSHDHGRWMVQTRTRLTAPPSWCASSLEAVGDTPWKHNAYETMPDRAELAATAAAAAAVTRGQLAAVLGPIAAAWANSGIEFADGLTLEQTMRRVGAWLEMRRDRVAARMGS